jgi:hypothetical protein
VSDEGWTDLQLPAEFEPSPRDDFREFVRQAWGLTGVANLSHIKRVVEYIERKAYVAVEEEFWREALYGPMAVRRALTVQGEFPVDHESKAERERVESYRQSLMRQVFGERPRGKEARAREAASLFKSGQAFFPKPDSPQVTSLIDEMASGYGDGQVSAFAWALQQRIGPEIRTSVQVHRHPASDFDWVHQKREGWESSGTQSWWERLKGTIRTVEGLEPGEAYVISVDPAAGPDRAVIHNLRGETFTVVAEKRTAEGVAITVRNDSTGEAVTMFEPYDHLYHERVDRGESHETRVVRHDRPAGWIADVEVTNIEERPEGVWVEGKVPEAPLKPEDRTVSFHIPYGKPDAHGDVFAPGCFREAVDAKRKELILDES